MCSPFGMIIVVTIRSLELWMMALREIMRIWARHTCLPSSLGRGEHTFQIRAINNIQEISFIETVKVLVR
mgnify:CR=1 FL=1